MIIVDLLIYIDWDCEHVHIVDRSVFIVFISRLNVCFLIQPRSVVDVDYLLRCARIFFHCMTHDANGKSRIETAHQANKIPKSSPIADFVLKIMVREPWTTAQVSNYVSF
jgi:hypothetical protein